MVGVNIFSGFPKQFLTVDKELNMGLFTNICMLFIGMREIDSREIH